MLLANIIPLALVASLNPAMIVTVLTLLLSANKPLARAIAFTIGAAGTCAVVGAAAAAGINAFNRAHRLHLSGADTSILFAIAGGLILIGTALEAIRGPRPAQAEQPARAKRAIGSVASRPAFALAMGAGIMLTNVKSLALLIVAVHDVLAAQVGAALTALCVCGFIVVMLSTLEVPILIYVADRERAATNLTAVRTWLTQHARLLVLLIGAFVGLYLLVRGVIGLAS